MLFMATANPDANRRNFLWLCLLRAILTVVLVLGMVILSWIEPVSLLNDKGVVFSLSFLTIVNVVSLWYLQRQKPVSQRLLFIQLLIDVLAMSLIFYRTGGASNPFVFWYLLPLSIAAAILKMRQTLLLLALMLVLYSLLFFYFLPFDLFSSGMFHQGGGHAGHVMGYQLILAKLGLHSSNLQLHMIGMWLNFLFSAALITFFVTRMSEALRQQDRELAKQHEGLLQREQVLSLGALAAGAAHELGTPLSTMAVLARDIEEELPKDSALREDVVLLRNQLQVCRNILTGLREQAQGQPRTSMAEFIQSMINRMEVLHPQRSFQVVNELHSVSIQAPATLSQVLINLLDNAAQAATSTVALTVLDESENCVLLIDDDGPGIAPDVSAQLGKVFVSNKDEGMGLGYFLSHASINQLGGSIHFKDRQPSGTRVELKLPWSVLMCQEH